MSHIGKSNLVVLAFDRIATKSLDMDTFVDVFAIKLKVYSAKTFFYITMCMLFLLFYKGSCIDKKPIYKPTCTMQNFNKF